MGKGRDAPTEVERGAHHARQRGRLNVVCIHLICDSAEILHDVAAEGVLFKNLPRSEGGADNEFTAAGRGKRAAGGEFHKALKPCIGERKKWILRVAGKFRHPPLSDDPFRDHLRGVRPARGKIGLQDSKSP